MDVGWRRFATWGWGVSSRHAWWRYSCSVTKLLQPRCQVCPLSSLPFFEEARPFKTNARWLGGSRSRNLFLCILSHKNASGGRRLLGSMIKLPDVAGYVLDPTQGIAARTNLEEYWHCLAEQGPTNLGVSQSLSQKQFFLFFWWHR